MTNVILFMDYRQFADTFFNSLYGCFVVAMIVKAYLPFDDFSILQQPGSGNAP